MTCMSSTYGFYCLSQGLPIRSHVIGGVPIRLPLIGTAPHPIAHALHPEGISKTNMMAESVN